MTDIVTITPIEARKIVTYSRIMLLPRLTITSAIAYDAVRRDTKHLYLRSGLRIRCLDPDIVQIYILVQFGQWNLILECMRFLDLLKRL